MRPALAAGEGRAEAGLTRWLQFLSARTVLNNVAQSQEERTIIIVM
jgi:hypothetical protein